MNFTFGYIMTSLYWIANLAGLVFFNKHNS